MDFFRIAAWEGTGILHEDNSKVVNEESYLSLKEAIMPIWVVNDCAEKSLWLVLIIILIG